jgi:hypothetical protein
MQNVSLEVQLLVAVVGVFALLYVLFPVHVRFNMTQSPKPVFIAFDHQDPVLPKEVSKYFQQVVSALTPLGFEVVTGLALPRQISKVKSLQLFLVNRASKDVARANVVYAEIRGRTELNALTLMITSRFRNDTAVRTDNAVILPPYPVPVRSSFVWNQFPMVRQADRLYRLHQALTKKHGSDSDKILSLDEMYHGDAVVAATNAMMKDLEAQVNAGYLYLSPLDGLLHHTWKGAFLLVWGLLPPISFIRRWRRNLRAKQLLQELESHP